MLRHEFLARHRVVVSIVFGVLLCVGGVVGCSDSARPAGGVQIVLITLDTLRYDSFAGSEERDSTMPELQRWARDATIFERFFSATSSTQPSHASMFTGLHPWSHGVSSNGMWLDDRHETVAETLQAAGFSTGAVVASFPVDSRFGFAQGFDHYDDDFQTGALQPSEWLDAVGRVDGGTGAETGDPFYSLGETVTERALDLLDNLPGQRRFFWFHYFDPHSPFGDAAGREVANTPDVLGVVERGGDPTAALQRVRRLYDADVRSLDRSLARLLQRLERDAATTETHVLLVADHGESFGEDGSFGHGERLIPSQIHVPFLLRSPALPAGVREDVVGSIDIAPTLLSLAGLDQPALGPDRSRDLTQAVPSRTHAFGMRRTYAEPHRDLRLDGNVVTIDSDDLLFFAVDESGVITRGNSESIDAPVEPEEDEAERFRRLFATFERSLEENGAEALIDAETKSALEALGYVG